MLSNDVFFLYPPGYCGNYLQWVINVSEKDRKKDTILDPLLPDSTTHGFIRKPTHISSTYIIIWLARNAPVAPQTFVVYCRHKEDQWWDTTAYAANLIVRARKDPRCVNISAVDKDEIYIGALNCYTKWPIYFKATKPWHDHDCFDIDGGSESSVPNKSDRNWLYDHWRRRFPTNPEFNWEQFDYDMQKFREWYDIRHFYTPHEVNPSEYPVYDGTPNHLIADIRLGDLLKPGFLDRTFIPWIEQQNIGDFDWDHARSYHDTYLAAQKNLQWLSSIKEMREHRRVDKFLQKNSLVQALVLDDIGEILESVPNWRELELVDILETLGYYVEK